MIRSAYSVSIPATRATQCTYKPCVFWAIVSEEKLCPKATRSSVTQTTVLRFLESSAIHMLIFQHFQSDALGGGIFERSWPIMRHLSRLPNRRPHQYPPLTNMLQVNNLEIFQLVRDRNLNAVEHRDF